MAFESLMTDFPYCQEHLTRNLRIVSRFVNPRVRQIAGVRNNRNYDDFTKIFLEQFLRLELESTEEYKRWQWLTRFRDYIKRRERGEKTLNIEVAREMPILSLYDFGKMKNGNYLCPFHKEKTASFKINKDNTWHCFGACGAHGDAIDFVMKLHQLRFVEAVKFMAKYD